MSITSVAHCIPSCRSVFNNVANICVEWRWFRRQLRSWRDHPTNKRSGSKFLPLHFITYSSNYTLDLQEADCLRLYNEALQLRQKKNFDAALNVFHQILSLPLVEKVCIQTFLNKYVTNIHIYRLSKIRVIPMVMKLLCHPFYKWNMPVWRMLELCTIRRKNWRMLWMLI